MDHRQRFHARATRHFDHVDDPVDHILLHALCTYPRVTPTTDTDIRVRCPPSEDPPLPPHAQWHFTSALWLENHAAGHRVCGVFDPLLSDELDVCIQRNAPALLARTAALRREQGGVLVRDDATGDVSLQPYPAHITADATPTSISPLCGASIGRPGWTVVGEYHTHPPPPPSASDPPCSPPSASDVYQSVLAAAQGHHNRSYVVATEGIYVLTALPSTARALMRDLRTFLRAEASEDASEVDRMMARCDEPTLGAVQRLPRDAVPTLRAVLEVPRRVYRQMLLTPPRADFAQELAQHVGVLVYLLPVGDRDPATADTTTTTATKKRRHDT